MPQIVWTRTVTTRRVDHLRIPINSTRNQHRETLGRQIAVLAHHREDLVARVCKVVRVARKQVYRDHRTPVSSNKTRRAPR